MPQHAVNTAMCMCTFGTAPAPLKVPPKSKTFSSGQPVAVITDNIPMANVGPFPPCNAPSNPTNWKGPVFTPGPCVPVIPAPWAPGSPTVIVGGIPALNNMSKCMCVWGGVISITYPGQVTEQIP